MIWLYFLLYGFAFGFLTSLAVKNKNRDHFGWFIIGFLFGVFGLVAAILVDKQKPSVAASPRPIDFDPSSLTKKCPDCAEVIKLEAKVCRFCQHRFADDDVASQLTTAEQQFRLEQAKLPELQASQAPLEPEDTEEAARRQRNLMLALLASFVFLGIVLLLMILSR